MISASSDLESVFARTATACEKAWGLSPYPVQISAAKQLTQNRIVEMQTGEGKTLTALLPIAMAAMGGQGCHVLTANDYLAKRDADFATPVLEQLGLSVGCVQSEMEDAARRDAYLCDVTYGTGTEVGFDFLRDRLRRGPNAESEHFGAAPGAGNVAVQRGLHFGLVDEADSLLIDDANTPLLIGLEVEETDGRKAMYQWANIVAKGLVPNRHFEFDVDRRHAHLTDEGQQAVALRPKPRALDTNSLENIFEQVEVALVARRGLRRDRDYLVNDEGVTIISESTGRQLVGRKWQRGLHFAVEAKERVDFSAGTGTAARISVQHLFAQYANLAGMTGTAWNARHEFRSFYQVPVRVVPTHKPCRRRRWGTSVFVNQEAKHAHISAMVTALLRDQRAVLLGTPSVEASERLSDALSASGIQHAVLNAVQHEGEAQIVAEAGQPGRVTIATNMAGRGTDIRLSPEVQRAGGLHVIATEYHSSRRIDRQLIGRAARQGDPGSFSFCVSLEDELFRHAPDLRQRLTRRAIANRSGRLPWHWHRHFRSLQKRVERLAFKNRKKAFKAEQKQIDRAKAAGLDPYLELVDAE